MNISWKKVIQYGAITGVAIWYVCLVGMVEAFDDRDVIDGILSLGLALLVVIGMGMGYFAAQKVARGHVGRALVTGLVTGLIGSLMTSILVILIETTGIRNVFVNASPALAEILTFSQDSLAVGLLMLFAFITVFSLLGAIIYLLPNLVRQFVVAGLSAVVIIGMLEELLVVIMARYDIAESLADFIFGKSGLSVPGAILVFLVFGGLRAVWVARGSRAKARVSSLPSTQQRVLKWIFIAFGIIFLITLPQFVGSYISQILVLTGLFALMALGLNIEIGLAGLLDLGFVGFFAIGAYTVGLFTSTTDLGLDSVVAGQVTNESFSSFWLAIPVAVAVSALAGVFLGIPVLRMRGDYLAIVTLGLAEIIRILVLSDFLRPALGGAQGILSIPKPAIPYVVDVVNSLPLAARSVLFFFISETGLIKDPQHFYYIIAMCCVIIAVIAWRLQFARTGRNWIAMREDEDVAEAMGINLVASKLLAFGMGASFAGLAGAIFATQVGSIFPHSFQLLISINVVSIVVIGGAGSIPGVIVGALVLVGLPELLREFAEFRLLIYGGLLVVMMLVKPEGLWPSEVVSRELHDVDEVEPLPDSDEGEPLPAGHAA